MEIFDVSERNWYSKKTLPFKLNYTKKFNAFFFYHRSLIKKRQLVRKVLKNVLERAILWNSCYLFCKITKMFETKNLKILLNSTAKKKPNSHSSLLKIYIYPHKLKNISILS